MNHISHVADWESADTNRNECILSSKEDDSKQEQQLENRIKFY